MKKLSWLLVLAVCCGGCAFGTRKANLSYPPPGNSPIMDFTPTAKAQTDAPAIAPVAATKGKVFLVRFKDLRADTTKIGQVRNGYGMRTADVQAQNDVAEWVTKAIENDLRAEGYEVTVVDQAPAEGMAVGGEVLTVFCDSYMTYEGEVSLMVVVQKDGKEVLKKRYTGKGETLNVAATSNGYGNTLAMGLQKAIKEFVTDFGALKP